MSRLYWSNLPEANSPRGGTSALCSSWTSDGLADPGIAGHQHQLRRAAADDAVEGGEQGVDLALAPVQLLGDQEPVRGVVLAERESADAALGLPVGQAAPRSRSSPAAVW